MSAAAQPGPTPRVEIWIRSVGTRRQAFWRCHDFKRGSATFERWQKTLVVDADKALRTKRFDMGFGVVLPVVSRETEKGAQHPAAAAFRESAELLNREIDKINGTTGIAA